VWKLEEEKFSRALGPVLAKNGIPNFAIEIGESGKQSNVVAGKILELLSYPERIFSQKTRAEKRIPVVTRKGIFSPGHGIFKPSKRIGNEVKRGERIGVVAWFGENEEIVSKESGILFQLIGESFVNRFELVGSIGKVEGWLR